MNEFVWSEVRDRAIRLFGGETPNADSERSLIEVFRGSPARFVAEVEQVAAQKARGGGSAPRSCWAVLRKRMSRPEVSENPTVTDESEKARAVKRVERWMRTAGLHCPSEAELLGELYGESELTPSLEWLVEFEESVRGNPGYGSHYGQLLREQIVQTREKGRQPIPGTSGMLRQWASDELLRERMVELWQQERPKGQLVEAEQERRAAEFVLQRKRMAAKAAAKKTTSKVEEEIPF